MPLKALRGQDQAVRLLQRAWSSGKLHHGWLLTGPSGVGKTRLAREMAQLLVCQQPLADGESCGHCSACRLCGRDSHPDILWIKREEGKTRIAVSQIRDLAVRLAYPPHGSGSRAVIFEQAEAMSEGAQNALLKTLEEPPSRTYLFLTTAHPTQLVVTVRSRCSHLQLVPLPAQVVQDILGQLVPDESEETVHLAARLAQGSVTKGVELTQLGLQRLVVTVEQLDRELSRGDLLGTMNGVDELCRDRQKLLVVIELLGWWYRDVMRVAAGTETSSLAFAHKASELEERAARLGVKGAAERVAVTVSAAGDLVRHNANARLTAEAMLLRMLS